MQALQDLLARPPIPAMTTDAEREAYYRLAKELAGNGAIVELGAWLGASSAYIAAGISDSGVKARVSVHDNFRSKPAHAGKIAAFLARKGIANGAASGPSLATFKKNLGPLLGFTKPRRGRIEKIRWGRKRVALLISDAPKQVPQISSVLTTFGRALQPGSMMAWQDFCHFPSYQIPASLFRIRERLEFVEAVVPGTTLVFRIVSQWTRDEVSRDSLSPQRWTRAEIEAAWAYWLDGRVAPQKAAMFRCGAVLFLQDIGEREAAVELLSQILADDGDAVLDKWRALYQRPEFVRRYRSLFDHLENRGALLEAGAMAR